LTARLSGVVLLNRNAAVIPAEKLRDDLLSPTHPIGRSKATFFRTLGYDPSNWQVLDGDLRSQVQSPLLESFVFSELLKLSSWAEERVMLFHYRDRDKLEVDFVLENSAGEIVGIEVKSAA
jgi:predicted AAA+ superfamily ATPase